MSGLTKFAHLQIEKWLQPPTQLMSCCSINGTNKFFSKHARRYARRFRRKGLDAAQKQIVRGISRIGVQAKTVLEVGCGVGGLHLTLLTQGASSATGIDMAEGMLTEAKKLALELGVSGKVTYIAGDFVGLNGAIPAAHIVVLDKVVCCYPDPLALIRKSAAKSTETYAISYPRASWIARAAFQMSGWLGEILRWSFHPYYHEPYVIEQAIAEAGFVELFSATTVIWQVKVFARVGVG